MENKKIKKTKKVKEIDDFSKKSNLRNVNLELYILYG